MNWHSPSQHTARQVLQDAYDQLNGLGEGLHGRIRIQVGAGLKPCKAVNASIAAKPAAWPTTAPRTANVNPWYPSCTSSSTHMGWRRQAWTAAASSRSLWRR